MGGDVEDPEISKMLEEFEIEKRNLREGIEDEQREVEATILGMANRKIRPWNFLTVIKELITINILFGRIAVKSLFDNIDLSESILNILQAQMLNRHYMEKLDERLKKCEEDLKKGYSDGP